MYVDDYISSINIYFNNDVGVDTCEGDKISNMIKTEKIS